MASSKTDEFKAYHFGDALTFLYWRVDQHIDWFVIFTDLKQRGISINQIGEILQVPPSTLKDWKNGGNPRFDKGLGLVWLWNQITGKQPHELPIRQAANDEGDLKPCA